MLKPLDSPIDLMLQGCDRDAVKARMGVDIGYNGCALRDEAKDIDRLAYKVEHVR